MKKIIFLAVLFTSFAFAQTAEMSKYLKTIGSNISIGSSTSEVKNLIGKPFAVEGGFPTVEELVLTKAPEHSGQMNYTTWYYKYPIKKYFSPFKHFTINNIAVSEYIFNSYKDSANVYFYKDKIIHPLEVQSYIILKNENLSHSPIKRETTKSLSSKIKYSYIPFLCIIFDKGTQVVADQKKFFLVAEQ